MHRLLSKCRLVSSPRAKRYRLDILTGSVAGAHQHFTPEGPYPVAEAFLAIGLPGAQCPRFSRQ